MSMRTIVEFNHDYAHRVREAKHLPELLDRAMSSGATKEWAQLEQYGIRRIVMVHHSSERKVVVHGVEHVIP